MADRAFYVALGEGIADLFEPLQQSLESAERFSVLLAGHGWISDPDSFDIADVRALFDIGPQLENLRGLLDDTLAADVPDVVALAPEILEVAKKVYASIRQLSNTPPQPLAFPFDQAAFWSSFPRELLDRLASEYVTTQQPLASAPLLLLGILDDDEVDVGGAPGRADYVRRVVRWDQLGNLVDPRQRLVDVYGWGGSFAHRRFLLRLAEFIRTFGFFTSLDEPREELLDRYYSAANPARPAVRELTIPIVGGRDDADEPFGVLLSSLPIPGSGAPAGPPQGFLIEPRIIGTVPERDYGPLALMLRGKLAVDRGITFEIRPSKLTVVVPGGESPALDAQLAVRYVPPDPIILIGTDHTHRVELHDLALTLRARGTVEGTDLGFEIAVENGYLVLDFSEADGFLGEVFGGKTQRLKFGVGIGWSSSAGAHLRGTAGLVLSLPLNLDLGVVSLHTLSLRAEAAAAGLNLTSALTGTLSLGPVRTTVEDVGVRLAVQPVDGADSPGTFGDLDVNFAFKPPTGLGLSIDGGGFKGGGFLSFEPDNKRYSGALDLEFKESIALKAIGLLTTEMPGGQPGFSLLVIITAEFQPIQLGLGFTLKGVGGLLCLNRTARIDRLRTGVRDNTLSSILFPTDVLANANRIISDLREVFPPQADRFVFGPMAKLGWGSPTIITIDLGLVIEVPAPVQLAILGVLRGLIPDDKKKLLRLQVNFLGVLELEEQRLAFDASLYDSKLLNYPLSGDMALRLAWGNNPTFLLSVGGFHPAYEPPPLGLPPLRRLTLQLTSGNNPRLTLETYFAVTSNAVQFGAKVELYASAGSFNVYGMLAFDALFQFNPFYFIADIAAKLALRRGSSSIASITLSLTLEGTTPWRARGTARLKLCWFLTVKVRFDRTFGETRDTRLDDVAVLPLLRAALQNRQNWRPRLPAGSHLLVTVREPQGAEESIVAHPVGVLEVSQKVVPLNVRIERFGHQKPSDGREFRIENVRANGRSIGSSRVKEFFAPAQFFERSDAQKLASKSFEKYDGGIRLNGVEELSSDLYAMREVEYELGYRDSQRDRLPPPARVKPEAIAFNAWASRGAIARSSLSFARTGKSALAPDAVRLTQEGYGVVSMSDLSLVNESSIAASEAEAAALMNDLMARVPTLDGRIQVVPLFEAAGSVR